MPQDPRPPVGFYPNSVRCCNSLKKYLPHGNIGEMQQKNHNLKWLWCQRIFEQVTKISCIPSPLSQPSPVKLLNISICCTGPSTSTLRKWWIHTAKASEHHWLFSHLMVLPHVLSICLRASAQTHRNKVWSIFSISFHFQKMYLTVPSE